MPGCAELALIHGRGQIPLAGVGQQHHNGLALIFLLFRQLQSYVEGAAGGNAHQDAFLPAHVQ